MERFVDALHGIEDFAEFPLDVGSVGVKTHDEVGLLQDRVGQHDFLPDGYAGTDGDDLDVRCGSHDSVKLKG